MVAPTVGESQGKGTVGLEFITLTIPQPDSADLLSGAITQSLQAFGVPLRWAITAVDTKNRSLSVEAVVVRSIPQNQ
ncbi:MAG: hypothetical protein AB4042_05400 [Leptolyngbyaceae cyanobacterium]